MNDGSRWALLAVSLALGCYRPDKGDPGPPQISVFVNSTRVEVIAQQPGSCRVLGDVQDADDCETADWVYKGGLIDLLERPDCIPDPTCVDELRLERAGELIASKKDRSAVFSTVLQGDETLVIRGCGNPLTIALPAPLPGVDLQVNADAKGVHLAAVGEGVQSTLGHANSLSFYSGFSSGCRSSSGALTLPLSPDYDTYFVESFALGEPLVLEAGSVRVYPAARRQELLSTTLPLGPIWQAAVAAAKLSPHFEACNGYCGALQQACDPTGDRDQCNVACVAEPTLRPSCTEEFERHLRCERNPIVCDTLPPDDESVPPPCAEEAAEYVACLSKADPSTPAAGD